MKRLAYVLLRLLIFLIPAENTFLLGGVTLLRLVGVAAFAIGLFALLPEKQFRPLRPVHAWMLLFTLMVAASYSWSQAPGNTLSRIFTYSQLLGMTWLVWEFGGQEKRHLGLLRAYVVGSVVSALGTIAQYVLQKSHTDPGVSRFAASGFDFNYLAVTLALSLPIAWYLFVQDRRPLARWIYGATLPVVSFAMILTGSRTGLLALLPGLLFVPMSSAKLVLRRVIVSIFVLLACAYAVVRLTPAASRERLSTVPAEVKYGRMAGRREIWRAALGYARDHLLLGAGAGAYKEISGDVAHNAFLSALVEEGIFGLVFFCGILVALLRMVMRMPPLERNLWLALLLAWGVGAAGLSLEYQKTTWFIFAMAAAQAALLGAKKRATDVPDIEPGDYTGELRHDWEGSRLPASPPESDSP
jgi:O-antigen ligase